MSEFMLKSEYVVSDPEVIFRIFDSNNNVELVSDTTLITETTQPDIVIVETNTNFSIAQVEMFVDLTNHQGGINDAPRDGDYYARKDGVWVKLDESVLNPEPDTYLYDHVAVLDEFRETALGLGLDPDARFISVNELISKGILVKNGTTISNPGAVFMTTPPQPTAFRAVSTLTHIYLSWNDPRLVYTNHLNTRVYRSLTNDFATATQLIQVVGTDVIDTSVQAGLTYYYWIRHRSLTNVLGPESNGSSGSLLSNVSNLLQQLSGQIQAEQLATDLREPIELITASDGIIFQQQQLADQIEAETNNRISALTAETEARLEQISNEIADREAGMIELENSFNTSMESINEKINYTSSVSNANFDAKYSWYFDADAESWTANGGAVVISGGRIRAPFSLNTFVRSPEITLIGDLYTEVRARIRKVGNPVWDGSLSFVTSASPSWLSPVSVPLDEPEFFNGYTSVLWNMSNQTPWIAGIIKGIQIQLSTVTDASNYFEIDWVAIGHPAPGASVAFVKQEILTQSNAVSAEATARESLATQLRGGYTGTDVSSVTTGLIYSERTARVAADNALSSQITALSAGTQTQFDQAKIWYFDTTIESWDGSPTNPTVTVPGWIRPVAGTGTYMRSPTALGIDAVKYGQVRARLRKVGSPTWTGNLLWFVDAQTSPDAVNRIVTASQPTWDSDGVGLVTWNPGSNANWTSTVNRIRVDLTSSSDASNYIEMDWIAIGRPSPGASSAELLAEQTARTSADTALSNSITSLTTTVGGKASQSSVDTLTSQVSTNTSNITSQGTKITQIDSQLYPALINDNPSLIITPPATNLPDGWSAWDMTGVNKYTGTYAYSGGNAVQMVCTTSSNCGIQFICNGSKVSNHAYVDIELVFTITSGTDLSGAGLLFDWFNTSTNFRTSLALKDILPTFDLNRKYVIKQRLKRPAGFTGTFSNYQMWLMGNYIELGTRSNHTIIYDNIKVFGSDASAQALQLLDARVTTTEGVTTSQSSSITNLRNELALTTNLLNNTGWVVGNTGTQPAGTGDSPWVENGGPGVINKILSEPGPFGAPEMMWVSAAGSDNTTGSGGFNVDVAATRIAKERGAAFYLFVKHDGPRSGSSQGGFHFGGPGNRINDLSGTVASNPYFFNFAIDTQMVANEWYLCYGVIKGYGTGNASTNLSGLYRLSTGDKIVAGTDYIANNTWNNAAQTFRGYLFYSNQSGRNVWWSRITVLPLDIAPTPWELMRQDKRLPATATALTALTSEVHDSSTGLAATVARTAFLEANVPGGGGNLLQFDTEFLDTTAVTANWVNATRNLAGSSWTPIGVNQIGYTSPGQTQGLFDVYSVQVPAQQGKRYGISAYTAGHRCTTQVLIAFYNSANAQVGVFGSTVVSGSGGGQYLSDWNIQGVLATAPVGTIYMRFILRGNRDTGQNDPYIWMARPMLAEVSALQTSLPKWAPSSGGAIARIASEETARANADSALSTQITNVTTTVDGHTSTISTQQTSLNGLTAQYMVKLDVNGYVSGFGLYNAGSSSTFLVNSDKFAIGKPGSTGILPFVVDTVNNRVAMDGAYIKTATIQSASIASLNASKIVAGTITTDKLVVGAVTALNAGVTDTESFSLVGSVPTTKSINVLTYTKTIAKGQVIGDACVFLNLLPSNVDRVEITGGINSTDSADAGALLGSGTLIIPTFPIGNVANQRVASIRFPANRYLSGNVGTFTLSFAVSLKFYDASGVTINSLSSGIAFLSCMVMALENKV